MSARTHVAALDVELLAGPFSLIGRGPLRVKASPGLVVHVQAGLLAIRSAWSPEEHLVRAGRRFIARHAESISIEARGRVELRVERAAQSAERLLPDLVPVGC